MKREYDSFFYDKNRSNTLLLTFSGQKSKHVWCSKLCGVCYCVGVTIPRCSTNSDSVIGAVIEFHQTQQNQIAKSTHNLIETK